MGATGTRLSLGEEGILADAFHLKPAAAIEYLRQKGNAITWDWHEMWQQAHQRSFTVAKVMRMDILQDIRDMVDKATDEGWSFGKFKSQLEPQLKAKGWWGKQEIVDKDTGEVTDIQLGSPRRLKTIYDTNLRTQYAVGQWDGQYKNRKNRPYLEFLAVIDDRTSDKCRALHHVVLPIDDPVIDRIYPPNHFHCRLRTRTLSQTEVERRGLTVDSSEGRIVEKEVDAGGKKVKVTGYKTGHTDSYGNPVVYWTEPGWDYNPGRVSYQPDLTKKDLALARRYVQTAINGPDFTAFFKAKGAIHGTYPVAVLPDAYKNAIGATTNIVGLSAETLKKNVVKHPELSIEDYQFLQNIIEKAQIIIQDGDTTMVFIRRSGKVYHAAIKATKTGKGLFLTSLRLTNEEAISEAKKKGKIVRGSK
jgi:SPP1 gp7 family putative phage head morphogenesis protein